MRAQRQNIAFCPVRLFLACAVCLTPGFQTQRSSAFAQEGQPQKRILLMYGDGRVELYPPPDSSTPQQTITPVCPSANPDRRTEERVESNWPPGARQRQPVTRLRFPSAAPDPWARSTPSDIVFRRPGDDNSTSGTVSEPAAAVGASQPPDGTFRQPVPPPHQGDRSRPSDHPFQVEEGQPDAAAYAPPAATDESAAPSISIVGEEKDESPPREYPLVDKPAVAPAVDQETGLPVSLPVPLSPGRPISGTGPVRVRENTRGPDSSADWLGTGIVQVVGTLVGLFIGLLMCAVALLFVLRRYGSLKFGSLIRVEIAKPPFADDRARSLGGVPAGGESSASVSDVPVPVADFGDQCIPFHPLGETYDERRQAKTEQRKRQEEEILKQIIEKNVVFRQEMSRLGRAA
jgi:hypothetical protein